jgi:hypothetical protein
MGTGKAFELSPFSFTGKKLSQGTLDPDSSYLVGDPGNWNSAQSPMLVERSFRLRY